MSTLDHIVGRFQVDLNQPSPFYLHIGRFKDIPRLFHELGFRVGAEVGVYQGEYSRYLLKYCPGLKLYGVDLWTPYKGYKDFKDNDVCEAYEVAVKNTNGYDCTLIRGDSAQTAKQFDDESLDFVFIDGNHAYEYVVADIAAWEPKVRKGGIIYGHDFDDYSDKRRWKEMTVIPAVEGWMKARKIHPWFVLDKNRNRNWLYVKS